jgi:hypothetical protein
MADVAKEVAIVRNAMRDIDALVEGHLISESPKIALVSQGMATETVTEKAILTENGIEIIEEVKVSFDDFIFTDKTLTFEVKERVEGSLLWMDLDGNGQYDPITDFLITQKTGETFKWTFEDLGQTQAVFLQQEKHLLPSLADTVVFYRQDLPPEDTDTVTVAPPNERAPILIMTDSEDGMTFNQTTLTFSVAERTKGATLWLDLNGDGQLQPASDVVVRQNTFQFTLEEGAHTLRFYEQVKGQPPVLVSVMPVVIDLTPPTEEPPSTKSPMPVISVTTPSADGLTFTTDVLSFTLENPVAGRPVWLDVNNDGKLETNVDVMFRVPEFQWKVPEGLTTLRFYTENPGMALSDPFMVNVNVVLVGQADA